MQIHIETIPTRYSALGLHKAVLGDFSHSASRPEIRWGGALGERS